MRFRLIAPAALLAAFAAAPAAANPALVVDAASGRVLHAEEAGRPWLPASLTKMMTAYVTLKQVQRGRITLDTGLPVSVRATRQAPSKMGFKPGTVVTVDNALKIIMVKSANDVSVALAEGVGGSVEQFVALMNAEAARLGMTGSHFANPNGLPGGHQSVTARDMAVLARALLAEFPDQGHLWGISAIKFGEKVIRNHNHLIGRYPGADGFKTGFVCASGFNVVATASRGGRKLIAVVLGATSARGRAEQAARLFERSFASWGGGGQSVEMVMNQGGTVANIREEVCRRRGKTIVMPESGEAFEAESIGAGNGQGSGVYAVQRYNQMGGLQPFAGMAGASGFEGASLLMPYSPLTEPVPVFIGGARVLAKQGAAVAAVAQSPANEGASAPQKGRKAAAAAVAAKPVRGKPAPSGAPASAQPQIIDEPQPQPVQAAPATTRAPGSLYALPNAGPAGTRAPGSLVPSGAPRSAAPMALTGAQIEAPAAAPKPPAKAKPMAGAAAPKPLPKAKPKPADDDE